MWKYIVMVISVLALIGCGGAQVENSGQDVPAANPPAPKEVATAPEPVAKTPTPSGPTTEVRVLGKEGFSADDFTARVGQEVTFVNQDPAKKDFSITFQKQGTRTFLNSEVTRHGDTYTHVFNEPGTYDFWTIGYGVRGTVTVQ
jgi:plastocyanin